MPGGRAPARGRDLPEPGARRAPCGCSPTKGRDAYYRGPIADGDRAPTRRRNGGFFAKEDFAQAPLRVGRAGLDQLPRLRRLGAAAATGRASPRCRCSTCSRASTSRPWAASSADFWHVLIEAKKLAFADRARYYADPDFAKVPVRGAARRRTTRAARAKLIDMAHAASTDAPGDPPRSTAARPPTCAPPTASGMMVSLIQSNYTGFGSGYVVPELGFGLQDRGDLFALAARAPQLARAGQAAVPHHHPGVRHQGRRAAHGVRRDGRRHAAAGARAGARQPRRLRHEPAGGRRRHPLPPHRLVASPPAR